MDFRGGAFAYLAMSLDGYIAGEGGDLSWLPEGGPEVGEAFAEVLAQSGCLLMGRNTYDAVAAFPEWPYGETPVLVATGRPFQEPPPATVTRTAGPMEEVMAQARSLAGDGRAVYVDGGDVVSQALEAGLLQHLVITMVPAVLGKGTPLFRAGRAALGTGTIHLLSCRTLGNGLAQLHYRLGAAL